MPKLYSSYQNCSKLTKNIYVPRNNVAKPATKVYGSKNGVSKLIFGGSLPSFDPTNPDWNALSMIVKAGKAQDVLSIGQELPVRYDSYTMPMIVVDFQTVTLQDNSTVANVPVLLCKYCNETGTAYHSQTGANMKYSTSKARNYILNTMMPKFDADFVAHLGAVKKQQVTTSNGGTDTVYDKMWLPSSNEIGFQRGSAFNGAAQYPVEGATFAYFAGINGNSGNTKRVFKAINAQTSAQNCWLRSSYLSGSNYQVLVSADGYDDYADYGGYADYGYYSSTSRVAPAMAFIG